MGENPKYVFNYGSLSLENIHNLKKINLKVIESEFNFKFQKDYLLVTIHPETLNYNNKRNLKSLK